MKSRDAVQMPLSKGFCALSGFAATEYGLDAGANWPQQERRKVRMIGRFAFSFALGPLRFGTADRRRHRRRRLR